MASEVTACHVSLLFVEFFNRNQGKILHFRLQNSHKCNAMTCGEVRPVDLLAFRTDQEALGVVQDLEADVLALAVAVEPEDDVVAAPRLALQVLADLRPGVGLLPHSRGVEQQRWVQVPARQTQRRRQQLA